MIHGGELAAERSMLPTRRWPIDVTAWPLENLNVLSTSEPGMSNDPLLRPQLKKTIGGLGFLSLAFGSMIGVGWITALGEWFQHAGPGGTMLAFAAGGLLMILIGSCYAELTPMLPVTGGEVAYAYKAFGTDKAFLVGWFLAFGYLGVSAFEAVSIGMVLAYLFPQLDVWPLYEIGEWTVYGPHLALAFLFTGIITTVNFLGVGLAMRLQVILTGLLVICALLFVAAGIGQGSPQNLVPHFAEDSLTGTWKGILIVFVMAPFMFVGFDTIPQAAEERAPGQPAARLGLYILLAIIGSTVFYVLVVLAAGMVTPWQSLIDEKLPTATAFRSAFASPALANLVLCAGVIGLLTSWNGFFLAGTRVLFSLGRARIIDHRFGEVHPRFGTPVHATIFSGLVTALAACLGRGALLAFINVGSFCISVAFVGVALSLLRLRVIAPKMERPYRLPAGKLVAGSAAAGSLLVVLAMVIPASPAVLRPIEWAILAGLCLCGIAFWTMGRPQRETIPEEDRARLILDDR